MQSKKSNGTSLPEGRLWEKIESLISEDKYKSFLKEIDPAVFKMVLNESKRLQVSESILTMLENRDPENATKEHAEKVVDLMKELAKRVLEKRSVKTEAKRNTR